MAKLVRWRHRTRRSTHKVMGTGSVSTSASGFTAGGPKSEFGIAIKLDGESATTESYDMLMTRPEAAALIKHLTMMME